MQLRWLSIVLICLVASAPTVASVYKWIDGSGQVHYGEPPPHDDARELKVPTAPTPDAAHEQRRQQQQKLLRAYEEERAIQRREEEQAQRPEAEREFQCRRARANIENARNSSALYAREGSGEKQFLCKAERHHYEARLEAEVQRYCR